MTVTVLSPRIALFCFGTALGSQISLFTTLNHSLFSRITHLEILESIADNEWDRWSGLAVIPQLTHVSFNGFGARHIFKRVLDSCRSLQAMVVLFMSRHTMDLHASADNIGSLAQEPRFIVTICPKYETDWQVGAWGGDDYWRRADILINKRKSGEIDRLTYVLEGPAMAEDLVDLGSDAH
ncbi:hypothetical protein B0H10DRAFT_1957524 [Mycena sp. CBHHK59/15]|nr:hypothetical protein B0H10DRAFT_1957524 [Mycena sp. CBHHK59/15]